MRLLLGVCDNPWQAAIRPAYTAGLREAEIWNLTCRDIVFHGLTVAVIPEPDTNDTWSWTPRDFERRSLPLGLEAKQALLRLRQSPGHPYVILTPKRCERIQAGRRRGERKPYHRFVSSFLQDYHFRCRPAGVPEDDVHALRKTAIANWLEAGVPPHEVQKMAGHSSVQTTMRYNVKVNRSAIDRDRRAPRAYSRRISHAG
ncbi:MAG: site-specific integrase [Planctomycetota bacterium]